MNSVGYQALLATLLDLGTALLIGVVVALSAVAAAKVYGKWATYSRLIVRDRERPAREAFIDLAAERERLEVATARHEKAVLLRRAG